MADDLIELEVTDGTVRVVELVKWLETANSKQVTLLIGWLKSHLKAHPPRCPKFPKGERCALEEGHMGGCKWGRGD